MTRVENVPFDNTSSILILSYSHFVFIWSPTLSIVIKPPTDVLIFNDVSVLAGVVTTHAAQKTPILSSMISSGRSDSMVASPSRLDFYDIVSTDHEYKGATLHSEGNVSGAAMNRLRCE